MCSIARWAQPSPPMPEQAGLFRSGVPLDSPLEGHSLWDLALITPGFARSYLFYLIFHNAADMGCILVWPCFVPDMSGVVPMAASWNCSLRSCWHSAASLRLPQLCGCHWLSRPVAATVQLLVWLSEVCKPPRVCGQRPTDASGC